MTHKEKKEHYQIGIKIGPYRGRKITEKGTAEICSLSYALGLEYMQLNWNSITRAHYKKWRIEGGYLESSEDGH